MNNDAESQDDMMGLMDEDEMALSIKNECYSDDHTVSYGLSCVSFKVALVGFGESL